MAAIVRNRRETTRETRRFKAHDQLLVSVIKRQAGSLWKAVVEGVMNAVDAGATKCEIDLTPQMLSIKDNGKGFKSKEEIEQFFEVFGQPHEDIEDKTFGQFRMGRGQLFAYGRNVWRTGKYQMVVDINKDGLDYHLEEGLGQEDGCNISVEFYETLTHTAHAEMIDLLEQNCRYVTMALACNSRTINKVPATQTWDMETEEASIRFRQTGSLIVYNQGIKVCEYPRYRLGCTGEVVTKKNLTVNFARNDIMSNCPIWAKIQASILSHTNATATATRAARTTTSATTTRRRRTPALTEQDRVRLCGQAKDRQLTGQQLASAKLILPLCSSVNLSITQLYRRCQGKFTIPPTDHPGYHYTAAGNTMWQHKMAFPVSPTTLTRWGVPSGVELSRLLHSLAYYRFDYVAWSTLMEQVNQRKTVLEEKDLNRVEAIVLATLHKFASTFVFRGRDGAYRPARQIQIGESTAGDSWTDGRSVIVISRDTIRQHGCGPQAWIHYALLMLHEMCHRTPTLKRHPHSAAFYKEFHDTLLTGYRRTIPWFVARCTAECPMIAERINRRLSRTELAAADRAEAQARRLRAVVGVEATATPEPATTT